jgi:hypothetical protein
VLKELLERSKQNKEKYTPCAPSHLPAETKLPDDDDLAAVFPLSICWN